MTFPRVCQSDLEEQGFCLCPDFLAADQIELLLQAIRPDEMAAGSTAKRGAAYGIRNLLWDRPDLAAALTSLGVDAVASSALGGTAFPISAIFFDKNRSANWMVGAHQDLVMPVESRQEIAGYSRWSEKLGVTYVEPPAEVLQRLIALRIHFDDCGADNGALAVAPGSHTHGNLPQTAINELEVAEFVICHAAAGDILLMKPLLVHRSSRASNPARRRVLHVVYATEHPSPVLHWRTADLKKPQVGVLATDAHR